MIFDIDNNRKQYIYDLFINHEHLLLDWDRRTGKSNYSVTCILDYAMNHPSTNHLIIGEDDKMVSILKTKLIVCNQSILIKSISKLSSRKIVLNNNSCIYFGFSSVASRVSLDTILLDELGVQNKRILAMMLSLKSVHPKSKFLFNCTNDNTPQFKKYCESLYDNMTVHIDTYKSDSYIFGYFRRNKINKIVSKIMV